MNPGVAESNSDKLYFLEQHTQGKSCDQVKHMPEHWVYESTLELLQDKYENQQKVAITLIEKASKWPQIEGEDGKALSTFSVFLVICRNKC